MLDPVILPNSRKIVDRSTIARHLLRCSFFIAYCISTIFERYNYIYKCYYIVYVVVDRDQSDPFNRSPLNLQDVIPAIELREEILKWMADKRNKAAN